MAAGFQRLYNDVFTVSRGSRPSAAKYVIVLTDGTTSRDPEDTQYHVIVRHLSRHSVSQQLTCNVNGKHEVKNSSRSDLQRWSLGLFEEREEHRPNKNKMSSDMRSVPDPKIVNGIGKFGRTCCGSVFCS